MSYCTECGKEVKPGTKFCTSCGAPIAAKPATPAAQPARAPKAEAAPIERPVARQEKVKGARPKLISQKTFLLAVIFVGLIVIAGVGIAFLSKGGGETTTTPTTTTTTTTTTPPARDLTEGVVLYEEGELPGVAQVTYVNRDGTEISGVTAYAGMIVVLAEPGTYESEVSSEVIALGGQLVMELPEVGVYWAEVAPGSEADFISHALNEAWVVNAYPLSLGSLSGELTSVDAEHTTGWFWDAYDTRALDSDIVMIDAWSNDASPDTDAGNGQDHGATTSSIASGGSDQSEAASKTEIDIYHQPAGTGAGDLNMGAIVPSIMLAAMNANDRDRVTAINISINALTGLEGSGDLHGRTEPAIAQGQQAEQNYLEGIFSAMETMGQPFLDHVLVNISAGNSGMDLTGQYAYLKARYPNAWDHIIMAGGIDALGDRIPEFNSSEDPDDVLYAEMPEGLYGTSFSAPQFTSLAAAVASERPGLKSGDIKRAIFEAGPVIGGYHTRPTLEQVLAKADELFAPSPTTTTTTTSTTTTATGPVVDGDWTGDYNAAHTEWTDSYTRYSGGAMTWNNVSMDGNYFEGELTIDGIQVLDTSSGTQMWRADGCTGTVYGWFSDDTNLTGTLSFTVPETESPPRDWEFTAYLEPLEGHIHGSFTSSNVNGQFVVSR